MCTHACVQACIPACTGFICAHTIRCIVPFLPVVSCFKEIKILQRIVYACFKLTQNPVFLHTNCETFFETTSWAKFPSVRVKFTVSIKTASETLLKNCFSDISYDWKIFTKHTLSDILRYQYFDILYHNHQSHQTQALTCTYFHMNEIKRAGCKSLNNPG